MSEISRLPDKHIYACGGLLFRLLPEAAGGGKLSDRYEVLLIFRRGFWDLPKGKRDPGESIPACAAREVSEEIGIPTPFLVRYLTCTQHMYLEGKAAVLKTTWWYTMVTAAKTFSPQLTEGIEEIRWVPLADAMDMVEFENLREVLRAFAGSV